MSEKYIIYASDRGYWRAESKGYTLNPELAGLYDEDEAKDICGNTSRKEEMHLTTSRWYKARCLDFLDDKQRLIDLELKYLTRSQLQELSTVINKWIKND